MAPSTHSAKPRRCGGRSPGKRSASASSIGWSCGGTCMAQLRRDGQWDTRHARPPATSRPQRCRIPTPVRPDRGDAAEGVVARERAAPVDAEGHWLAVAVVPASVQDRDALEAPDAGKARWPTLREGVYDGAFAAGRCREWSNRHGMRHRVVARDPQAEGFVVLARRRVVERSFGWLSHWGGRARDRGGRPDVSAARLALVGVLSGFEALLDPMPVRAPAR